MTVPSTSASRYPGPADPSLRRAWRASRREVALTHHPDRGGSEVDLTEHLGRVDREFARRDSAEPGATGGSRRPPVARRLRRARRRARRVLRGARSRLPRGWPGSRHYIDL